MTYREVYEKAEWKLERGEITIGEFDELTKSLDEEIRPHGEWEHWGSPFSDDSIANSIVCSLCKARYVEIEDEVFNFCPNCGADMRKER